jgi:peptidoglycan L-alanyl-D-glutamate endopeptidase CwlK
MNGDPMMNMWSAQSASRLATCDHRLQEVFDHVLQMMDCTVLAGHRNAKAQNHLCDEGKSQLRWPHSRHNSTPANAIDIVPCPVDWQDRERMTLFAGMALGVADANGIKLRWGGDWDRDGKVRDNRFDDLVHFELMED